MKTNEELQKDVQEAIKWEPLLNAAEIGVIAKNGVVTLTGTVDSYVKKAEAEDAAKSVKGVKVVVENLEVKFNNSFGKKEDHEIASELIRVADWNSRIPKNKLKAKVEKGWVTLEGEVEKNYQKEAAENIAANLLGVRGVTNNVTIRETEDQADKKEIERALRRNLFVDDSNIKVDVSGHKLTLTGTVPSWHDKAKAERIAWNATGITKVENDLEIDYDF
ncbi:MAG: BON domain-containing protein [Bacteroidales bacterium]